MARNKFAGDEYVKFYPKLKLSKDLIITNDSILVATGIIKFKDVNNENRIITVTNRVQATDKFNDMIDEGVLLEVVALGQDVDDSRIKVGDKVMFYPQSAPRGIYAVERENGDEEVMILFGSSSVSFLERAYEKSLIELQETMAK